MKNKYKLYLFICLVLVGVLSSDLFAAVQTTYTKSGNQISVKVKSDADHAGVLQNFAIAFRYPNAGSPTLAMVSTSVYPSPVITVNVDPTNSSFNIALFEQYDGTTTIAWNTGVENPLFIFNVVGGFGSSPCSLATETSETFAFVYYQLGTSTDITNNTVPFYPGSDNLTLSASGDYKYATQNVLFGKYWLGTGTSNWTTDANWSDGAKPTGASDVTIVAGGVQPIADAGSVCNKLVVEAGASVDVAPTGTLTVNSDLSVASDNSFVVQSGGSLIVYGAVPSGNRVKVQRYIAAANWSSGRDGWHFLSSPVAAQAITGSFVPTGGGNDFDMYVHDEPTHYWKNQKDGANAALFVNFTPGKGYLVAYQQAGTKEFVGTLNTASISGINLTNSGNDDIYGFTFVGNPYSSALNWDNSAGAYGSTSHICNFAYVWNSTAKAYSILDANSPIPAMNGFMVYTDLSGTTLTIPNSKRIHSSTAFYKAVQPQIRLIARDIDGESYNTSYVRFDATASAGFEMSSDAPAITGGFAPMFYSTAGNKSLTMNTLPEAYGGLVIPFGFVKNEFSNYTIELAESIDGHTLNLHDLKTNTVVNLTQNPVYSFNAAAGDDPNRFVLVLDSKLGVDKVEALAAANVYSIDNRIGINNVNGDTQMDIINVQGQLLKSFKFFSNGNHEISVNLATGVYMVRLSNSGELRTMKVFVK